MPIDPEAADAIAIAMAKGQPATGRNRVDRRLRPAWIDIVSSFHADRAAVTLAFLSILTVDSCTTKSHDGADFIRYDREQRHAPAENIWNHVGVWKRVSDNPVVYMNEEPS